MIRSAWLETYCLTVDFLGTHRDMVIGLQSFEDHNDGVWAEIPIPEDSV